MDDPGPQREIWQWNGAQSHSTSGARSHFSSVHGAVDLVASVAPKAGERVLDVACGQASWRGSPPNTWVCRGR